MFFNKKKPEIKTYDKTQKMPVLKTNMYTGEKVIGFKDINSGKFEEVQLIRDEKDLNYFMKEYNITEQDIKKEY